MTAEVIQAESPWVFIAVMGATGAGKSTFIKTASGDNSVEIGHSLRSCTSELRGYKFYHGGFNITLIDSPGFDDAEKPNVQVLGEIAEWLQDSYKQNTKLSGIINMHRINDERMTVSARRNLHILRKLCGEPPLSNIALVTSFWDQVSPEVGMQREQELKASPEFWGTMVEKGSRISRFTDRESALSIILSLANNTPLPLCIQQEMVDQGKLLIDTEAGIAVNEELDGLERRQRDQLKMLEREFEDARKAHDLDWEEELRMKRQRIYEQLDRLRMERQMLREERGFQERQSMGEFDTLESLISAQRQEPDWESFLSRLRANEARISLDERKIVELKIQEVQKQKYEKGFAQKRVQSFAQSIGIALPTFAAALLGIPISLPVLALSNWGNERDDSRKFERGESTSSTVLTRPLDRIRATIQSKISPENGTYELRCKGSWQILEFCRHHLNGNHSLHHVITLTGTHQRAQATTCEDFVKTMWHSRGLALLDGIVSYLSGKSCEINFSATHKVQIGISTLDVDSAEISVSGSLDEVVATIEQLVWLAAVFRPPTTHGLTISSATFEPTEPAHLDLRPLETVEAEFVLNVDTLDAEELKTDTLGNDISTCWQELFHRGVLAYGFPVAPRDEGYGLEIPFELMASLAQVSVSMDYDGGTILLGHSTLLFPSEKLQKSVQWHFVKANGSERLEDTLKLPSEWLREKDISVLTSSRTFLGYYPCAHVLLGTEEHFEKHRIGSSDLPDSKSRIELAREGTTSAGFSVKGIFNGSIGGKWMVPQGLRVDLTENHGYYDRLEKASERPILLYDCISKSAWLIAELSLVLHMVLSFLKQPRIQRRRRTGIEREPEAWPPLPFAQACDDGGKAAWKVIDQNQELFLYSNEHREKVLFWNVVDNFLKDLGSIRSAVNLRKSASGWQLFASRLQGWDFNDLATKEESVHQKELPQQSKKASWWQLAEAKDLLVIFGNGFGPIILPDLTKTKVYSGWEFVPAQAELLAASMPCLLELAKQSGRNTQVGDFYLTPKLAWHKPTTRDDSCNEFCNSNCHCIQELRQFSIPRSWFITPELNHPGKLLSYQAMIFGDPKHYHQSLSSFASRVRSEDHSQPCAAENHADEHGKLCAHAER